ncbi:MAG TPA: TonB family protein [Candidatus Sulfopaludibacter sp.]|nr:TonB family protein [Candidatus Sulfopaludibacter sp.]
MRRALALLAIAAAPLAAQPGKAPRRPIELRLEAERLLDQQRWDEAEAVYERLIVAVPLYPEAYYALGFIAWSKWYPAYTQARQDAGMGFADPGPIPNERIRRELKARWDDALRNGLAALDKALAIKPEFEDAMSFENLLIRERADLRDTAEEWQADIRAADEWMEKLLAIQAKSASRRMAPVSVWDGSRLLTRVEPVYPPVARQALIEGTVTVDFTLAADGHTKDLGVRWGHPLLRQAALDAVRQWVYAPVLVNGQPVEVKANADVPFVLPQ